MIRIFLLFSPALAWSEEALHQAGAHHVVHVPWMAIFVQAFNLFILLAVLGYFLRHTVKSIFKNRVREYKQLVERAEAARLEAEQGKSEIERRLAALQAGAENTLEQAGRESEELKRKMMVEAEQLTKRLEQDAKRTVAVEVERAKLLLQSELLTKALEMSSSQYAKSLGTTDQQKLNNEFVEKIQVVGG